ncbi:hypothetical protein [Paenibacillus sp. FSL R10-2736]|uniref:hypothetical protein n=1 Tax=Paenibacillus sp. FSL R10-2736 TaxID=2954692 RepID=UPI004046CE7E
MKRLKRLCGAGMLLLLAGLLTGAPSVSAATVFDEPLTYFNSATWQKADGYSNGGMFNCTWRANNISFTSGGQLRLALTSPSNNKFDGAEMRSVYKYGYGKYEVSIPEAESLTAAYRQSATWIFLYGTFQYSPLCRTLQNPALPPVDFSIEPVSRRRHTNSLAHITKMQLPHL